MHPGFGLAESPGSQTYSARRQAAHRADETQGAVATDREGRNGVLAPSLAGGEDVKIPAPYSRGVDGRSSGHAGDSVVIEANQCTVVTDPKACDRAATRVAR